MSTVVSTKYSNDLAGRELSFTGERIVPGASNCEPLFALKMYQEHIARYLFAAQCVRGKAVLDVGCGVGYGAQLLARSGASKVTAFDISTEAIQHARRFYPHSSLEYLVSSAEEFSLDDQFDVVTCFELIEHLHDQHRALQLIASALKPEGALFISTPRPTGKVRSAFHTRELRFLDFKNLLECHFSELRWFFENNHFASLVCHENPTTLSSIQTLHPQFSLGQADYFLAVASRSPVDPLNLEPQLVLNDDAYVSNLEKDVQILHSAVADQEKQIKMRDSRIEELVRKDAESSAVREEASRLRAELEASQARESELSSTAARLQADAIGFQAEIVRVEAELLASRAKASELRSVSEQFQVEAVRSQSESARLEAELRAKEADLRIRQAEVDELTAQTERLHRNSLMLSATPSESLVALRRAVAKARAETEHVTQRSKTEIGALLADLTEARETVRKLKAERNRLDAEVSQLQARVAEDQLRKQAVLKSRSWRITEPLRWIAYRLRGRVEDPFGVYTQQPAIALPDSLTNGQGSAGMAEELTIPPSRLHFDIVFIAGCHEGESKRYRVANLIEGLVRMGFSATSYRQDEIERLLQEQFSADAVVLFRTAYDANVEALLAYCSKRQIVSIFDIDDLVFEPESIDYVRVVKDKFTPEQRADYRRGVELYRKALLACDRATCTTEFLAQRIRFLGKRADVIPNGLNDRQLQIANEIYSGRGGLDKTDKIRIGYFSGSNTHQVDFRSCEDGLMEVLERYPTAQFVLVGVLNLDARWEPFRNRIERYSLMPYEEMLRVKATIDINLAPLEVGNPYCESKSQLKIFEAGIVGKPTVASSVSSYAEAISDGIDGFLAHTPLDWKNSLETLIESPEMRERMGKAARVRALEQFSPRAVVERAVHVYGFDRQEEIQFDSEKKLRITWIIPRLLIGGGGHRNILRAAYFLEKFGHDLDLYFTNMDWTPEQLKEAVNTHFYPLECKIEPYRGVIRDTDVLFATHWSTVEVVMRERSKAREVMYFVQDFEPAFAPMGTEYILAENTYRLGLYAITSGPWCEKRLRAEFGCQADHFLFPVDRSIYHPRVRQRDGQNIVFFAKPEMPRRCYELGILCLTEFSKLCDEVEIILFGSPNIDPSTLPFRATVQALVPTIEELGQMYCNADLGIAFSTTNPSLVPYEMMASGLPVVDVHRPGNEVNYGGRHDIAFLADPNPVVMARQIARLLQDKEELQARSKKGLEFIHGFPSEYEMARRVEELILKRMAKLEAMAGSAT